MTSTIHRFPVSIPSSGGVLAGLVYRNVEDLSRRQPGVVVSGSWLTVKEQMSHVYAARLATQGFTVLTFDFTGFGESSGHERQLEMPVRKIDDILAATRFLATLSCVAPQGIGYLAICASAQYAAAAIERGAPVRSLASIAGWFHDTTTVAAYYGGESGVNERLRRATQALESQRRGAPPRMVPAYEAGNDRAAMFIPLDYYANLRRGALPRWRNEMDEASWLHWLAFDGLRAAEKLRVPTLFVHGDECALPDNVRRIHERMPGPAQLAWRAGFQVDFYDRDDLVGFAVAAAVEHFRNTLTVRA